MTTQAEKDRMAQCVGKFPHDSWRKARQNLKITLRRRKKKRTLSYKLNVYHCRFCQKWHIGGLFFK